MHMVFDLTRIIVCWELSFAPLTKSLFEDGYDLKCEG
jgi:hypothetical protein